MLKLSGFLLAASAVALLSGAARAGEENLPALSARPKPAAAAVPAELKRDTTAQVKAPTAGYTDFDAFSSVNDPLYRSGSRELLKQEIKQDASRKPAAGRTLRDAPISRSVPGTVKPGKALNRRKAVKPVRADPVKVKNTI